MSGASSSSAPLALAGPAVLIDALPYVDQQYNDPAMKAKVDALIAEELKTFRPSRDYLEAWPMYEPTFEANPMLQAEWMRVCDQQPMPKLDTQRYQLDPPPASMQNDPAAWRRAIDNAKAQLENQSTRIGNLELLQQHGSKLWAAHLNQLEATAARLEREEQAVSEQIEGINRKRKAEQLKAGPVLAQMEDEWIRAIKKNIEIEAACLEKEGEARSRHT
jgi:pre-mRNA-splicing factor SPF27